LYRENNTLPDSLPPLFVLAYQTKGKELWIEKYPLQKNIIPIETNVSSKVDDVESVDRYPASVDLGFIFL
jgi:hypothetical protein